MNRRGMCVTTAGSGKRVRTVLATLHPPHAAPILLRNERNMRYSTLHRTPSSQLEAGGASTSREQSAPPISTVEYQLFKSQLASRN